MARGVNIKNDHNCLREASTISRIPAERRNVRKERIKLSLVLSLTFSSFVASDEACSVDKGGSGDPGDGLQLGVPHSPPVPGEAEPGVEALGLSGNTEDPPHPALVSEYHVENSVLSGQVILLLQLEQVLLPRDSS